MPDLRVVANDDDPMPPEAWTELERDNESTEAERVHRPELHENGITKARAALAAAKRRIGASS